jgi:hypothetical protein
VAHKFKLRDRVTWNSEAGSSPETIVKTHAMDVAYKGCTHHAIEDELQYGSQNDKSGPE